jgi:hypothetical protein
MTKFKAEHKALLLQGYKKHNTWANKDSGVYKAIQADPAFALLQPFKTQALRRLRSTLVVNKKKVNQSEVNARVSVVSKAVKQESTHQLNKHQIVDTPVSYEAKTQSAASVGICLDHQTAGIHTVDKNTTSSNDTHKQVVTLQL